MYEKQFIGYEYQERVVEKKYEPVYLDAYPNFGWVIDQHHKSTQNPNNIMLHMKRNRDLVNRIEIKRLENKFQATMNEIIKIEKRNQLIPTIQACLVGLFGTALIVGGFFIHSVSSLYLSLLFGLVGFIGWVLPYFIYKTQFEKRTHHNQDSVESKYDAIYDLTKRAHQLCYMD